MSIHTPINFDPTQYEIIDYIDNQPPTPPLFFTGTPTESGIARWEQEVVAWRAQCKEYFGDKWGGKIHYCCHCGHSGHVRYIAVVRHLITGDIVPFGHECAHRLHFPDKKAFQLQFIQSKANREIKKAKINAMIEEYLNSDVELKTAVEASINIKKSDFVCSILQNLQNFGSLSKKQRDAFIIAVNRQISFEKNQAKEQEEILSPVPITEERIKIVGEVLTIKEQDTVYGTSVKMLVKAETGFKIWGTCPNSITYKGTKLEFYAQVMPSQDDKNFGFFKRPSKIKIISEPINTNQEI